MNFTKADLVARIRDVHPEWSGIDATDVVDLVFACLKERLAQGEKVKLSKFGTFRILKKASRLGRNPQTSEEIVIPAHKVVKFKASPALIEALNE